MISFGSHGSSPDFHPSSGAISQAMSPEKGPAATIRKESLDERAFIHVSEINSLGQNELLQILQNGAIPGTGSNKWCLLSTLRPIKNNGYIQISHMGANKFIVLHEFLLLVRGLDLQLQKATGLRQSPKVHYQGSHRCHNPNCVIPEHICIETVEDNNARKSMPLWGGIFDDFTKDASIRLCVLLWQLLKIRENERNFREKSSQKKNLSSCE
jgi:hypothetical protein